MAHSRPTVRVGVFIPVEAQLLDTAAIDIFCVMGHEYLSALGSLMPVAVTDLAPNVEILYISQKKPGPDVTIPLSAGMRISVDRHYSDPDVAPGRLTAVLIPGPNPAQVYEQAALDWLAAQAANSDTAILSVCTGIYLCGAAGLLTPGRKACGPRGLQDELKRTYPDVEFLGEKLRWVQDGNFWSSGGVTNGNDLVAAYARHSPLFPDPIVDLTVQLVESGDRPQEY